MRTQRIFFFVRFRCEEICTLCVSTNIFSSNHRPNHILMNEYEASDGIMAHKDGPAYFGRVAIISLADTVTLNFYDHISHSQSHIKPRVQVSVYIMSVWPSSLPLYF